MSNSSLSYTDIKRGQYSVLLTTPESAITKFWKGLFKKLEDGGGAVVSLLAFDEVHTMLQWCVPI